MDLVSTPAPLAYLCLTLGKARMPPSALAHAQRLALHHLPLTLRGHVVLLPQRSLCCSLSVYAALFALLEFLRVHVRRARRRSSSLVPSPAFYATTSAVRLTVPLTADGSERCVWISLPVEPVNHTMTPYSVYLCLSNAITSAVRLTTAAMYTTRPRKGGLCSGYVRSAGHGNTPSLLIPLTRCPGVCQQPGTSHQLPHGHGADLPRRRILRTGLL